MRASVLASSVLPEPVGPIRGCCSCRFPGGRLSHHCHFRDDSGLPFTFPLRSPPQTTDSSARGVFCLREPMFAGTSIRHRNKTRCERTPVGVSNRSTCELDHNPRHKLAKHRFSGSPSCAQSLSPAHPVDLHATSDNPGRPCYAASCGFSTETGDAFPLIPINAFAASRMAASYTRISILPILTPRLSRLRT
jgi:hypothetical protein